MAINKILNKIVLAGVFALALVPLVVSNSFLFPFISGKAFFFRIVVEIIFGAWLILAFRDKTYWPKFSWLLKTLVVFTIVVAIADWLSPNHFKSFWSNFERMEGFVTIAHLLALFIVAGSALKTERLWQWLFHTSIGTGVFLLLYGTIQLKGELLINQGGIRLDGTLGNASYLAGFLIFILFLLLFYLSHREKGRFPMITTSWLVGAGLFVIYPFLSYFTRLWDAHSQFGGQLPAGFRLDFFTGSVEKWLLLISVIILIIFPILLNKSRGWSELNERRVSDYLYSLSFLLFLIPLYYTATRGAQVGLVLGLGLTALLVALFEKENHKLRRLSIGFLSVAVLVLVLIFGFHRTISQADFVKQSPVLSRYSSLLEQVVSLDKEVICRGELKSRCLIWPVAWQGFKERPIFGWGQESFNYVFNKYYDYNLYEQEQWFDRAHNVFFDWLIAGGILGLLSYLSLYVFLLIFLWRPRVNNSLTITGKAILSGLVAAYFVHNFFVFDNLTSYLLFFTLLSYAHARFSDGTSCFEKAGLIGGGVRDRIFNPAVIVVTIMVIYFVNVPAMRAGNELISGLLPQSGGFSQNFEYYKKAIGQNSFANSEIREQLFQRSLQILRDDKIDNELKNGFLVYTRDQLFEQLKVSPDDARYQFFTGVFFNQVGLNEQALVYLEKAHELSLEKQAITINLASVYVGLGRLGEALQILKTASDATPKYDELRLVYAVVALYDKQNELAKKLLIEGFGSEIVADQRLVQAYQLSGQPNKAAAVQKLLAGS